MGEPMLPFFGIWPLTFGPFCLLRTNFTLTQAKISVTQNIGQTFRVFWSFYNKNWLKWSNSCAKRVYLYSGWNWPNSSRKSYYLKFWASGCLCVVKNVKKSPLALIIRDLFSEYFIFLLGTSIAIRTTTVVGNSKTMHSPLIPYVYVSCLINQFFFGEPSGEANF